MPITELAQAVYGDNTEQDAAKVRSLLSVLKNEKKVVRHGPSQWEVAK